MMFCVVDVDNDDDGGTKDGWIPATETVVFGIVGCWMRLGLKLPDDNVAATVGGVK